MSIRRTDHIGSLFVIVAVMLFTPHRAAAQVHDNAHVFAPRAKDIANTALAMLVARHNKQLVIETFSDVAPERQLELDKEGKQAFFTHWLADRARAERVNGVMALVCMNPRYVIVGAGAHTRANGTFTSDDVTLLRRVLQDDFHANQFDAGLADAIDLVDKTYTVHARRPAATRPATQPTKVPVH